MREEIGLHLAQPPQRLFKLDACRGNRLGILLDLPLHREGPFDLHPDEIETGAWFAPEQVTAWVRARPQAFASAFVVIWRQFNFDAAGPLA